MTPRKKRKTKKKVEDYTHKQRELLKRIFLDKPRRTCPTKIYDENVHPEGIIEFFKNRFDQIRDAEKYVTEKGQVGYVMKPIRPPTLAGYAAHIGVSRITLWDWRQRYEEFDEAVDLCKAMQEALLVELGTTGALNPAVTNFTLKNLQDWMDKVEETHKGTVALQFDGQDAEA